MKIFNWLFNRAPIPQCGIVRLKRGIAFYHEDDYMDTLVLHQGATVRLFDVSSCFAPNRYCLVSGRYVYPMHRRDVSRFVEEV